MNSILKIGIAGLGVAGLKHVATLAELPGVSLFAAEPDSERASAFSQKHGAPVFSDVLEMLERVPDLHALVLCTTSQTRAQPLLACCVKKIPFFCEKPPAHQIQEAQEILAAVTQSGILTAVGFQYRWHPLVDRLIECINGRPPLFARSLLARPMFQYIEEGKAPKFFYQKAECGGPVLEQGSHFIDLLRYVTRDEPVEAQAMVDIGRFQSTVERDCEETSAVTFRHASGMISSHIVNWSHQETVLDFQVVGPQYDLTWSIPKPSRLHGMLDGKRMDESIDAEPFALEMNGFVTALRTKSEATIRCTYQDAVQSLLACEMAAAHVK